MVGIATLDELRMRLAWPAGAAATVPVGVPELARLLPQGYRARTLTEWVGAAASGAATLALRTAVAAAGERPVALIGPRCCRYAPALAALGVPLARTLAIATRTPRDFAWAVEEALRCPALGAVVAWPGRLDERAYRRWQLAAGQGCRLGVVVRGLDAEHAPCWAAVRWRVDAWPGPERLARVALLRSWGTGRMGESVKVRLDGETMAGGMVPQLADPTVACGAARA